jgi:hypothetical protein
MSSSVKVNVCTTRNKPGCCFRGIIGKEERGTVSVIHLIDLFQLILQPLIKIKGIIIRILVEITKGSSSLI